MKVWELLRDLRDLDPALHLDVEVVTCSANLNLEEIRVYNSALVLRGE